MIVFDPRPEKIISKMPVEIRNEVKRTLAEVEARPEIRKRHAGTSIYTVRVQHYCIGYVLIENGIRVVRIKKIK